MIKNCIFRKAALETKKCLCEVMRERCDIERRRFELEVKREEEKHPAPQPPLSPEEREWKIEEIFGLGVDEPVQQAAIA